MDHQPHISNACWSWPPLAFRLATADAVIAARAAEIMSRWPVPAVDRLDSQPVLLQNVEKLPADQWRFTGSQPEARGLCASSADVLRAIEADTVLSILNRPDLFLTIHGALVARGSQTVLIIGSPMSGKSSLACALGLSGWQLLCDDVTILSHTEGLPTATPVPRRINLRVSSKDLFSTDQWDQLSSFPNFDTISEGVAFHPPHFHPAGEALPLSAVLFVQPEPPDSGKPLLAPLHPAEALLAATAYTNIIKTAGMGDSLKRLSPILNAVPAFNLSRAELPRMISAIDQLYHQMATGA